MTRTLRVIAPRYTSSRLSPREIEILGLLCAGMIAKQIAIKLGISYRTVECHRNNMFVKTGCKTSCELGAWAVRNGHISAAVAP